MAGAFRRSIPTIAPPVDQHIPGHCPRLQVANWTLRGWSRLSTAAAAGIDGATLTEPIQRHVASFSPVAPLLFVHQEHSGAPVWGVYHLRDGRRLDSIPCGLGFAAYPIDRNVSSFVCATDGHTVYGLLHHRVQASGDVAYLRQNTAGVLPLATSGGALIAVQVVVRVRLRRGQGCLGNGGRGGYPPLPPSRTPSLCPATVPLTPSAGLNSICNRHQPPPTASETSSNRLPKSRDHTCVCAQCVRAPGMQYAPGAQRLL